MTDEQKSKINDMRTSGHSYAEIASAILWLKDTAGPYADRDDWCTINISPEHTVFGTPFPLSGYSYQKIVSDFQLGQEVGNFNGRTYRIIQQSAYQSVQTC